jgi:hypothetical protein
MSTSNAKKLKVIQKKAVRIITSAKSNAHTGPIFHELKILPYEKMQKLFTLKFMQAIEYGYCYESFSYYWPRNTQRNVNYELRNNDQQSVLRVNYVSLENCPLFKFPKIWNELPMELKLQSNKATFSYELTNTLLEEALNE